jgi:hypothetical protein
MQAMDAGLIGEVASSAAVLLAPFLSGAAAGAVTELEAAGEGAAVSVVRRLWDLVKGAPWVARVAEDPTDRHFQDRLEAELQRLLEDNIKLAQAVARLLADAEDAGAPVPGHALVQRVYAGGNILAEGEAATVRDATASGDVTARAKGAPPKA